MGQTVQSYITYKYIILLASQLAIVLHKQNLAECWLFTTRIVCQNIAFFESLRRGADHALCR
jgi:hypothetical protein